MSTQNKIDPAHPTIVALIRRQGNMSDKKYADRFLPFSETVWFRIKKGEYTRKDPSELIEQLDAALRSIEDHDEISGNQRDQAIVGLTNVKVAVQAVRRAFDQPRDRLCVILTPTGGGKTTMARAIQESFTGRTVIVEATEPWRTSYIAAIHAIGDSIGLTGLASSSRVAERSLLSELKQRPRIIVIDEGNYFGQQSLNLVKAILNQTQSTVVILALPELWNAMKRRSWAEAAQLRTRTISHVAMSSVTNRDVELLLTSRMPNFAQDLNGSKAGCISQVTDAANSFGLYDTVVQIADAIRDEAAEAPVTPAIVERAIRNVKTLRP
jgi:hypothetical protein